MFQIATGLLVGKSCAPLANTRFLRWSEAIREEPSPAQLGIPKSAHRLRLVPDAACMSFRLHSPGSPPNWGSFVHYTGRLLSMQCFHLHSMI